jgi:hypothetical protein
MNRLIKVQFTAYPHDAESYPSLGIQPGCEARSIVDSSGPPSCYVETPSIQVKLCHKMLAWLMDNPSKFAVAVRHVETARVARVVETRR